MALQRADCIRFLKLWYYPGAQVGYPQEMAWDILPFMKDATHCPFSKPIIGRWCRCPYARMCDRCAGKLACMQASESRASCLALMELLKERSRFVLGLSNDTAVLTHAQLMKIRCGGLLGMQRVLGLESEEPPSVPEVIAEVRSKYGDVGSFPFNEIVKDIQAFTHRKKPVQV